KSPDAAYYTTNTPGARLDTIKVSSKYSVLRVSKHTVNQAYYRTDESLYPYLFNESVSVIYDSSKDSFNIYLEHGKKYIFKANTIEVPFDESNYESTTYFVINRSKIYKTDEKLNLLCDLRLINKELYSIDDFQVVGNLVLFKSDVKVTNKDIPISGEYVTRNGLSFNPNDSFLGRAGTFLVFVTEFGILDLENQTIFYPPVNIINN
ncbi:MAG: hypothetical protein HGA53_08905, partial [Anaerolineaceae bacterium]|nr:hypothetical protein [Anaerolineaceae bacterium]